MGGEGGRGYAHTCGQGDAPLELLEPVLLAAQELLRLCSGHGRQAACTWAEEGESERREEGEPE